MSSFPSVSVLVPTRNRSDLLGQCVTQFLEQNYPGSLELLIVEDGDCAGPRFEDSAGHSIRHFYVEGTTGEKLNFAVSKATGDLCVRFDDDDIQRPDRIWRQVEVLEGTRKPVTGMSSVLFFSDRSRHILHQWTGFPWHACGATHAFTTEYARRHAFAPLCVGEDDIFLRDAYEANQLSSISGANWCVMRNHSSNTAPRNLEDDETRSALLQSENWREIVVTRQTLEGFPDGHWLVSKFFPELGGQDGS